MDHQRTYKGKTAVVTGGAGFIGSHLCDALLVAGNSVICVDDLVGSGGSTRNVDHLRGRPDFTLVTESIVDWAPTARLGGVDCIFHQAASKNTVCMKDPELDLMVNGMGTLKLLLAAHDNGVRKFVHGSTGSVFGQLKERQDENHPKNPVSFYGVSKLAGESYCRVFGEIFGLDYTVFRYYHVIGPRQDSSDSGGVVPIFVRRSIEDRPMVIYGTGEQIRSFTSVFDVVEANIRAAEGTGARQRYLNCASGVQVTIQELADFIGAEMGNRNPVEHRPWRAGDIFKFDIDNSAVREALGMAFDTNWRGVVRQVIAAQLEVPVPSRRRLTRS